LVLEKRMDALRIEEVERMDATAWHSFLREEYFPWKYTAANRLATTRASFDRWVASYGVEAVDLVRQQLLQVSDPDPKVRLDIALRVGGLGPAGASGLLSLMFPSDFGTADQFVVLALRQIPDLAEKGELDRMNAETLSPSQAVTLIKIMKRQAWELNRRFGTREWTPRKVDMVLWAWR